MKCIIVVDDSLPLGLIANTAAALGISLGNHIDGLIGPDVCDKQGCNHKGITAIPIPILSADKDAIKGIYQRSIELSENMTVIGFSSTAQKSKSYGDYMERIGNINSEELDYLGICVYGPQKMVNSLSGQLKLLK